MAINKPNIYNSSVEIIAQEARVAKTNESLADICLKLNVADVIYLGKVDLWLAKQALSAVYRTLKKYPALRAKMNYFGTLNGFMNNKEHTFLKVNSNCSFILLNMVKKTTDDIAIQCRSAFEKNGLAIAFVTSAPPYLFSGIIINGKSLHQQTIINNIEFGERFGHSPKGCKSVKSVVEHEVGHILDFMLNISNSREYKKFIKQFDVGKIGTDLSKYCVTGNIISDREVVAEAYSEYCNNPRPRLIASTIGSMFDKKYKELYGG